MGKTIFAKSATIFFSLTFFVVSPAWNGSAYGEVVEETAPSGLPWRLRLERAAIAGVYLSEVQKDNGQFVYAFNPLTGWESTSYNWLRHAGTVMSLCQLYRAVPVPMFRRAAQRGAEALLQQFREVRVDGRAFHVPVSYHHQQDGDGRIAVVKTGGCALSILALLALDEINDSQMHRDIVLEICRYLRTAQREDGNIWSQFFPDRGEWGTFESRYYPGETLLAMAMAEKQYPDSKNRQMLSRLLHYLTIQWQAAIQLASDGSRRPVFDHWGMIGLSRCLRLLSDEDVASWSPAGTWTMTTLKKTGLIYCHYEVCRQVDQPHVPVDGSFFQQHERSAPTAIRLEGITAMKSFIEKYGDEDERTFVKKWTGSIMDGRRFLLRCQYTADDDFEWKGEIEPFGGIRRARPIPPLGNGRVQIDYCQHAISALLGW